MSLAIEKIPFNKPHINETDLLYIAQALQEAHLSGDGAWTKKCHEWIKNSTGCLEALLTHSCTGALEMCAILADFQAGDEVIMSSFTFVSTANAFVLRGGVPVFVDVRPDTMNIDEKLIEAAITPRTKAIAVMHYAGVACNMDVIMDIAKRYNLIVIEDAAQALGAFYKGKPLGTIGQLGCFSFHATKNVISGEGGALLINDPNFVERAKIIREKGTNRAKFLRGEIDKYTWVDIGSSYLPSEVTAAFLYAQLERSKDINEKRLAVWQRYHKGLKHLEEQGKIQRPIVPKDCQHNAHIYYILPKDKDTADKLMVQLKTLQFYTVAHYIPLHSSPGGIKFGRVQGEIKLTDNLSDRLVRLPLWPDMTVEHQNLIIQAIEDFY